MVKKNKNMNFIIIALVIIIVFALAFAFFILPVDQFSQNSQNNLIKDSTINPSNKASSNEKSNSTLNQVNPNVKIKTTALGVKYIVDSIWRPSNGWDSFT